MYRRIDEELSAWKSRQNRKPLILRGARQVGKTFTVSEFGKTRFDSFFRIDFTENPAFRRVFEGSLSPLSIVQQLEAHFGHKVIPGESLLFLDEIQACPNALKSLRFFFEQQPELHVIAAGSLLELSIGSVSFPVGSVEYLWMYPMDFSEFLLATGNPVLIESIPSFLQYRELPDTIHELFIDHMRKYFVVGGMPEAVKEFANSKSTVDVHRIHSNLVQSYLDDINKYSGNLQIDNIDLVLVSIAQHVGRQMKYSSIAPDWRTEKTRKVLALLEKILLIHRIFATTAQGIPLGASVTEKVFKCLFLDVGLMHTLCGVQPSETLLAGNLLDMFRGALAEQFAGQQILAHGGCENRKMFYWSRQKKSSTAEVDYVMTRNGNIYPIEVKSGAAGRFKSLALFLEEHRQSSQGIVLSLRTTPQPYHSQICFCPLYSRFD